MPVVTNRIDLLASSALATWTELTGGAGTSSRAGIDLASNNKAISW